MITKEEVAAIQLATILDARSSERHDGAYFVSLCYYSSQEPNMSVSFVITQGEPGVPKSDPVEFWNKTFGPYRAGHDEAEREEAKEKGEEGEHPAPRKIDGVGDEAFWNGNRFGGALDVLKDHLILRVSVGGGDDQETKIAKSKALAEKALSHL